MTDRKFWCYFVISKLSHAIIGSVMNISILNLLIFLLPSHVQ